MSAASAPLNRVLTGTSTAPAWNRPSAATIHSAQLEAQMATRSPGSMPEATSAAPNGRDAVDQLGDRMSRRLAVDDGGRSPNRSAAAAIIAGIGVPPVGASGVDHRRTASSTFIRRARLPPMILRTVSSGSPSSSST